VNNDRDTDYDLIVVGGGPGGAACATLVAMQRHRVLLLEKSQVPSFKIGESLLPVTIHGICALLGVGEELSQAGFVVKTGGRFVWGHDREPWDFLFSASTEFASPTSTAYQVEREVFDGILLRNAAVKGVDVRLGCAARDVVTLGNGQAIGVRYTDAAGTLLSASARYIVDASGQLGCFNSFVGKRIYSEFFQNMSVFRYYQHGGRLPEPVSGNVLSVAFEHGWFWYIPLRNGLTSVGAVFGQEQSRPSTSSDALFDDFLSQCPEVRELLAGAVRVTEGTYGRTRIWRDFSYTTSAFFRNGVILVGDAACFLDPLFSSGVHMTTYSALLAARSINTRLRGLSNDEECFTEYEIRFRREFALFYDFIAAFYDVHRQHKSDFWNRRKVSASPERWNAEYTDLLDGVDGFMDSPTGNRADFWKARTQLGAILFPQAAQTIESELTRRQRSRMLGSLFRELTELQLQAILEAKPPTQAPIRQGGLISSPDGLHWTTTSAAEGVAAVI
jgi:FAD-dependent halogenase